MSDRVRFTPDVPPTSWVQYAFALLTVGGWTALLKCFLPTIELVNLAMSYLLINVLITLRYGQGPSVASALLSVACFNFFFVPPYFTFAVADVKYLATFFIMLAVTMLTSRLMIQLRHSAEKTVTAEKMAEREGIVSALLSSVSHDLRTPLTSISGAASTLLAETHLPSEDQQRLLETINSESDRLNRLVGNILQITKIESGHIHVRKELHSLEEIIGSALDRLTPSLKDRPLTTDIPEDLPLVPMDDLLIEQVMINLLENAIRYTPAGSILEIRAFQHNGQVQVEVLDRGPGIPREDHTRIFEKFYRSGPKKNTWGSGLGLAICQGILLAHGGSIGMRDREGGGSIFYFVLPLTSCPVN